jgi:hypothetical protein
MFWRHQAESQKTSRRYLEKREESQKSGTEIARIFPRRREIKKVAADEVSLSDRAESAP